MIGYSHWPNSHALSVVARNAATHDATVFRVKILDRTVNTFFVCVLTVKTSMYVHTSSSIRTFARWKKITFYRYWVIDIPFDRSRDSRPDDPNPQLGASGQCLSTGPDFMRNSHADYGFDFERHRNKNVKPVPF